MKMDVSLTEALTGLRKAVKTLDDRTLVIQTVRGEQSPLASSLLSFLLSPLLSTSLLSSNQPYLPT